MNTICTYGLSVFVGLTLLIGCSEGDVINTTVNFEAPMSNCGNTNSETFVFYKIDAQNNQLLSFSFTSTTFSLEEYFDETVSISLNSTTNKLLYRKLNTPVEGVGYFCSSIPPSDSNLDSELISEDGVANILYQQVSENPTSIVYQRTLILQNTTLEGNGISLRNELFQFGSDTIEVKKE